MPNNPNRRPGVDANIVEANTVRGHDTQNTGAIPGDLLITTGRNDGDDVVGIVTVWNRTDDRDEQVVDLRAGLDVGSATRIQVFVGDFDPTGIVTATQGSLFVNNNPAELFQNTDGSMAWIRISDDLGGESLEETLVIGNSSGPNAIVVSNDPLAGIQGEDSIASTGGGTVRIRGGNEAGAVGDGGGLSLGTGTTTGGNTGALLAFTSAVTAGAGFSGDAEFGTGTALVKAGTTTISAGSADAGGAINILAGEGIDNDANAAAGGGHVSVQGGNGVGSNGGGGDIILGGGDVDPGLPIADFKLLGQGGRVRITAGLSAGAVEGAGISLQAGRGGPAGGVGGRITLTPGLGGGAAEEGQVVANGVFRSDNIQRGSGDPNVGVIPGSEGDLYQRLDGGQGEVWVNTNGSAAGWARLAVSGSLVAALTRVQSGSFEPAGSVRSAAPEDRFSATGLLKGLNVLEAGTATVDHGAATQGGGPMITFNASGGAGINVAGIDQLLNMSSDIIAVEHDFISAFKFRNTGTGVAHIMFMGYSSNDINTQLSGDNPAIGEYVGLVKSGSSGNWFFVNRGPSNFNLVDSGIGSLETQGGTPGRPHYYVIDTSDTTNVLVRHLILNSDFEVLAQFIAVGPGGAVPGNGVRLQLCMGVRNQGSLPVADLQVFKVGIVTQADKAEELGGGGGGLALPTLEQVLIAGNETGTNSIALSVGGFIGGVLDGAAPDGAPVIILGGYTTGVGDDGGAVQISGGISTALGATGNSGGILFLSGTIADATASADTGPATFGSGPTLGTGDTGNVVLATGPALGGGTTGDILMAPGTLSATGSIPGLFDMRGGSTTLAGVDGGNVEIKGGESTNAASSSTGQVRIETPDSVGTGAGGNFIVTLGDGGPAAGLGGNMLIAGGTGAATDDAGSFFVLGGVAAGTGQGGEIFAVAGASVSGDGGAVTIASGSALGGAGFGGDIDLTPGTGPSGDGVVRVNGKLEVTGLIDPTGLVLNSQVVNPYLPGAPGEGTLWIDVASDELQFTTSAGTVNLSTGGAGGTLSSVLIAGDTSGGQNIVMTGGGVLTGIGGTTLAGDITPGLTRPGRALMSDALGDAGGDSALYGGLATNAADGGTASVQGGGGGAGGGDGGQTMLRGGDGGGGGDGGDILLIPGTGTADGRVLVTGSQAITGGIEFADGSPGITGADNLLGDGTQVKVSGGDSTGAGGNGGAVIVEAGIGDGAGTPGGVLLRAGGGGSPDDGTGSVGLASSPFGGDDATASYGSFRRGTTAQGGEISLTTGDAPALSDGVGGAFLIEAGAGDGAGDGGVVTITGGVAGATGDPGGIDILAGGAVPFSPDAGDLQLVGAPSTTLTGSAFFLLTGGANGKPAGLFGRGGQGVVASNSDGGSVDFSGGAGDGAGDGGVVSLTGGLGGVTGSRAGVRIRAGAAATQTISLGDIELVASPSATGTLSAFFLLTGGDAGKPGALVGSGGDGAAGTNSLGGGVSFGAGNGDGSGNGGVAELLAGDADTGDGGKGSFKAGNAGAGNGSGGLIEIIAGSGAGTGLGGNVLVQSGGGAGFSEKGSIHLLAEDGVAQGVAGSVEGVAASPPAIGNGGSFHLTAAGGIAAGGARLQAGDGLLGAGVIGGAARIAGGVGDLGGPVDVVGGDAEVGSGGIGGQVAIHAGKGDGPGAPGQITLGNALNGDTLNFDSPAIRIATFVFSAAVAPGLGVPLTYAPGAHGALTQGAGGLPTTPFTVPPRSIQITAESTLPGNVVSVIAGTLAAPPVGTLCVIDQTVGFSIGDAIHIVAYL
jgi:hypothetical protein